ncbi:MAG TPA: ABC transporter ATP-binding protein [Mycobacteriales bacterium]|jgi:iron(III) transport system ATP-binding protein|nr:ABC transporter ATP-binding protein [Mycobacteriales bacterium]
MLTIEDLYKRFPVKSGGADVLAIDGVTLTVEEGELFTMLGPSGCGKTTTLRSVAGLERPTSGRIAVNGRVLYNSAKKVDVPVNARGLGMVFQSYAIWPHMNVYKNVAFPLTVRSRKTRPSRKQIRERVERVLGVVQLEHLMDRPATDLSGGQQQRLALARALAMEPPLLLLDEPLSNLDAKLREQMRFELKRLQRETGITTVYVTHDQEEALSMSSRIAVMNGGKVEQLGKPREIYTNPVSHFVAGFIGTSNFVEGVITAVEEPGEYRVSGAAGELIVSSPSAFAVGDHVTVGIRPEHLQIVTDDEGSGPGVWKAEVVGRGFLGEVMEHELRVGESVLRMRSNPEVSVPVGEQVLVKLPTKWCRLIPTN